MKKLIAVRLQEGPVSDNLIALVARAKNRQRVWVFDTKGMTSEQILSKVAEEEAKRKANTTP